MIKLCRLIFGHHAHIPKQCQNSHQLIHTTVWSNVLSDAQIKHRLCSLFFHPGFVTSSLIGYLDTVEVGDVKKKYIMLYYLILIATENTVSTISSFLSHSSLFCLRVDFMFSTPLPSYASGIAAWCGD